MERITDAFAWPFRDPHWVSKVLIIGLILLVPILGAINGLGWMLAALARLREGGGELPAANFSYLGRGIRLFVVNLVYIAALVIVIVILYVPIIAIYSAEGRGSAGAALLALGVLLNLLLFSIAALGTLALYFAMPAIILGTDHGGISGGLNVAAVVQRMRKRPINTLIAGLMLIAVGFLAQLGLFICAIGVVFASAYALAAQAWIVRSYELGLTEP